MKIFYCLVLLIIYFIPARAQGGTWVWLKGSDTLNATAVYGTKGVAAAANTPQALYESSNWIDLQGNLWIFGGNTELDIFGINSDLWMYNPLTNNWTWENGPGAPESLGEYGTQGVPSPNNYPASRGWGALCWTDNNNDLWLYGSLEDNTENTFGYGNDLWRYHIATNEWTWMGGDSLPNITGNNSAVYGTMLQAGPNNTPGARWEDNSSWTDENNDLWLFGGGSNSGYAYNDLWKYSVANNEWTWMKGPQYGNDLNGNYGILGVENAANNPSGRWSYSAWKDANGNFYIWEGINNSGNAEGDVWKYTPQTNNWTWVAGDSSGNCAGNYNQYCTDNGNTGPRCRMESKSAKTATAACSFVFPMFGGSIASAFGNYLETLNDLWVFNALTNEWTWVSGTDVLADAGSYGTRGLAAPSNLPPARAGACTWVDNSGAFWVYGGINSYGASQMYNDVWKFVPDESCDGPLLSGINYQLTTNTICTGDTARLTLIGLSGAKISPAYALQWIDSAHVTLFPDSTTTYHITGTSPCRSGDTADITIYVGLAHELSLIANANVICPGDSAKICATAGFLSYTWNPIPGGATGNCIEAKSSGNYYVNVTDSSGCAAQSNAVEITVVQPGQVSLTSSTDTICQGSSAQICASPGFIYIWNTSANTRCITTVNQGIYILSATDSTHCFSHTDSIDITLLQSVPIALTVSADTVCYGDSATLCAAPGFTNYMWSNNTLGICTKAPNTGLYTVSATNNIGCPAQSNPVNITILPSGTPVSITSNADSLCYGDSANICATTGFVNYVWNNNASGICIKAGSTGNYFVNASGNSGCIAQSNTVAITIIHPVPARITSNADTICPSDSAQICAPVGYTSYSWNVGLTNRCINVQTAGNYYVSVTDNNGCSVESNHLGITVLQSPPISISGSGDTMRVYDATNIQWYLDGNAINGANQNIYLAHTFGTYTVSVTDSEGCTEFSSAIVYTGVEDISEDDNVSIYPNPLSPIAIGEKWQLVVGNNLIGAQLEILDNNGRVVYKSEIKTLHSEIEFSRTCGTGGVYLLRIVSGIGVVSKKIVKL